MDEEQAVQAVPVQPVPMTVDVRAVKGPQGDFVQLVFQTPQGISAFFLPPDGAKRVREQMEAAETHARSGLIVPGNGKIRPVSDQ